MYPGSSLLYIAPSPSPLSVELITSDDFRFPFEKVNWELIRNASIKQPRRARERLAVQQLGDIQSKVGILRIWPSIASGKGPQNPIADFFRQMKGVVLQTFGTGNAPSDGKDE